MSSTQIKRPQLDYPIMELLANRWSPYTFAPRPVEHQKLLACLEAARWAASSYNEQPWSFLVARREETQEFARMLECLVPANRAWAQHAGVLLVTVASKVLARSKKTNRVAEHDIGLAVGNLTVQATHLGLAVHQMAGVNLSQARETYDIPDSHDPLTAVAIGYPGDPASAASQELTKRDQSPRTRKPLSEFVFSGKWQQQATL